MGTAQNLKKKSQNLSKPPFIYFDSVCKKRTLNKTTLYFLSLFSDTTQSFTSSTPSFNTDQLQEALSEENVQKSVDAIQKSGEATSNFLDEVLETFGDDIDPEAKQKADEIKATFTNIASRLAGFAEKLQTIAGKVPELAKLISIQQSAAAKGITFEATNQDEDEEVLSFA